MKELKPVNIKNYTEMGLNMDTPKWRQKSLMSRIGVNL